MVLNVGINNALPAKKLDVYGSSGVDTAQIKIGDSSSTARGYIGTFSNNLYITHGGTYSGSWSTDGTNSVAAIVMNASDSDSSITFDTSTTNGSGPTTRLTIDKNGASTFTSTVQGLRFSSWWGSLSKRCLCD